MTRLFFICVVFLFSSVSHAYDWHVVNAEVGGYYDNLSYSTAESACRAALPIMSSANGISPSAVFDSITGDVPNVYCNFFFNGTDFGSRNMVREGVTCAAGIASYLSVRTTIASFNSFGEAVVSNMGSNPQCVASCVVSFPATAPANNCVGWVAQGNPIVVGAGILVVCHDPLMQNTGASCNGPGNDQQNVATSAGLPLPTEVDVRGAGAATTGGAALTVTESAALKATATSTAETSAKITAMSDALQGKLSNIAINQTTADTNAESRHVEDKGLFGQMVASLSSIDTKTGASSGSSACGGLNQPSCSVTLGPAGADGVIGAMPIDPIAEVPQGGLKAPGEASIGTFIDGVKNAPLRDAGTCPTWTISMAYFHRDFVMDAHCALFEQNRSALSVACTVIWSIGALGIVLRA